MARIVLISKYPPLEGGIAAKTYWLAQTLAGRGHRIHIVTDREDQDKVHAITTATSIPTQAKVTVHRPEQKAPWHIPHGEHRALSLLNTAMEVIGREKPDLIEAGYLVPYGLVAYLASKITGVPYVLQHGGSDVKKFLEGGLWPHLLGEALSGAECVLTDVDHRAEIQRWSVRCRTILPYVPNPAVFRPAIWRRSERPVLALIGKANYHWEHKGWHRVIDIWSRMGEDFEFVVVSQGIGLERFQSYARKHLGDRVNWQSFLPPWEMPSFLHSVDCLFHFEADLPFPMFSNLLVEALFCGTPVITDQGDLISRYRKHGLDLSRWLRSVLCVEKNNPIKAVEKIRGFIVPQADNSSLHPHGDYKQYISDHESVLQDSVRRETEAIQ